MSTALNNIRNFLFGEEKKVRIFLVLFFSVGVTGFAIPFIRIFFTCLTPAALLLSFLTLAIFHQTTTGRKVFIIFSIIFFLSFLIELAGVKTGMIFGSYKYGRGLGIQVLNTPVMIGINWLLLVYCTSIIFQDLRALTPVKILLSALLMLIYDIAMEQIAPQLDMWHFEAGAVPVRNYLSWFLIAVLLHLFIKLTGIRYENRLAAFIFFLQFGFFIILIGIFKFVH